MWLLAEWLAGWLGGQKVVIMVNTLLLLFFVCSHWLFQHFCVYICFHSRFLFSRHVSRLVSNSLIRVRAFGLHLELFMESVFLLIIPITVHFQLFSLEMFSIPVHILLDVGFLLLYY